MKFIIALILITTNSWSKEIRPLSIEPNKKEIHLPLDEDYSTGSFIYLYQRIDNKLKFAGSALINKCDANGCTSRIKKIRKNLVLTEDLIYSTIELNKAEHKKKHRLYGSVGGPLGFAYNLGYFNQVDKKFNFGGRIGLVSNIVGKVKINGVYINVHQEFELWKLWNIDLNPYFEIGYFQGTLNFSEISGPPINVSSPFLGLGMNVWKNWDRFFFIGRGGLSYNTLKPIYKDQGDKYNLSLSGTILVMELGIGFNF